MPGKKHAKIERRSEQAREGARKAGGRPKDARADGAATTSKTRRMKGT